MYIYIYIYIRVEKRGDFPLPAWTPHLADLETGSGRAPPLEDNNDNSIIVIVSIFIMIIISSNIISISISSKS